jgi:rhodanese-related sulfurtransferase
MFNLFGGKKPYEEISAQEAEQRIRENKPLVIDVRESSEFAYGHIKGAKLIPLGQLGNRINAIGAKDREIIVVCQSGSRSSYAAKQLTTLGFTKVVNLRGGMGGWMRAGLPVQR